MAASESTLSPSDPTSSLRAAALSTIKRKKNPPSSAASAGPSGKPLLARLPAKPDTTVQLDYGQEDTTPLHTLKEQPNPQAQRHPPDIDQNREEGEISDSEDSLPVPPVHVSPPPVPATSSLPEKPQSLTLVPGRSSNRLAVTPPPRSAIPKLESPAGPNLLDRISDDPQNSNNSYLVSDPSSLVEEIFSQLDENHVRPGLAMNQAQYDTAKDVVLDLLGWGVPPEFLVDCGLSRELVFYVFSELRLRLPKNLDSAGLTPYPPDPQLLNIPLTWSTPPLQDQPRPIVKSESESSLVDPVNAPPAISRKVASPITSSDVISTQGPSGRSPPQDFPSAAVSPLVSALDRPILSSPLSGSLHDMERQRRQELLARKAAVQASRKSKQAIRVSPATQVHHSAEPPSAASAGGPKTGPSADLSVDDFLNSIAPSSAASSSSNLNDNIIGEPSRQHSSPDAMDVDAPTASASALIPNIGDLLPSPSLSIDPPPSSGEPGSIPPSSASSSAPKSFAEMQDSLLLDRGYSHTVRPQTNPEPPPLPIARSATLSTLSSPIVTESSPLSGGPGLQRRGTKRPVAADFVDFDGSDGQNRRAEWNSPSAPSPANSASYDRVIRRRLTVTNGSTIPSGMGGFASVSGMRQCIIDLSDSDGEDDGTEDRNHLTFRPDGHSRYSPTIRNSRAVGTSGRATPSTSMPPSGVSPQVSAASLFEKEEQIRKMKELIALAEQKRQQKQAITRSTSVLPEPFRAITPSADTSIPAHAVDGQTEPNPEAGPSDASIPTEPPPRSRVTDSPMIDHGKREDTSSVAILSSAQDVVPEPEEVPGFPDGGEQLGPLEALIEKEKTLIVDSVDVNASSTQVEESIGMKALGLASVDHLKHEESLSSSDKDDQVISGSYVSYESPFGRYPLLRCSVPTSASSSSSPAPTSPRSALTLPPWVDVEPLRVCTLLKKTDPLQQICQYEVPGGGVCRDSECADVHVNPGSRRAKVVEPSDDDCAQYVYSRLPRWWLDARQVGVEDIRTALLSTGQEQVMEERVQKVLRELYRR